MLARQVIPLRKVTEIDRRAAEMGHVVQEIIKRFEAANVVAANGPHVDLTIQETRVVELLGAAGGQMMRAVAEHLGVAVNSVTSIVDGLERKGLLTRVRSSADRRVVHVELTAAGAEASQSVLSIKTKFHREMLAALTDEEQAILLVLLRKIGGLKAIEQTREATAPADVQSPATNGHPLSQGKAKPAANAKRKRN